MGEELKKFWRLARNLVIAGGIVFALALLCDNQAFAASYKTVNVSSSDISSDGAYSAIQAALNKAKSSATSSAPYKVVVPSGSYTLTKGLHIYSNTWLYADGVTFKQSTSSSDNMVRIGAASDTQKGYYYKNITIQGATFDQDNQCNTTIKLAHATNVTVKTVR